MIIWDNKNAQELEFQGLGSPQGFPSSFSEGRDNLCGGNRNTAFSAHLRPASGHNSIKGDVNFLCSSPWDGSLDAVICDSRAVLFNFSQLFFCLTRDVQLMPAFNVSGGNGPMFHLF